MDIIKLESKELHPRKIWVECDSIPIWHLGDKTRPWSYQISPKKYINKDNQTVIEDPYYTVNKVFNELTEEENEILFEILTNLNEPSKITRLINKVISICKPAVWKVIPQILKPKLVDKFVKLENNPGYSKIKSWDKEEYDQLLEFVLLAKITGPLIISLAWNFNTSFSKEAALAASLSQTKIFDLPAVEKFLEYQRNSPIADVETLEARGLIPEEFITVGITVLLNWSIRLPVNTNGASYLVGFLIHSLQNRLKKPPGGGQIIGVINPGAIGDDKEDDLITSLEPGTSLTALETLLIGELLLTKDNLQPLLKLNDDEYDIIEDNALKVGNTLREANYGVNDMLINLFIARLVIPEVHDKVYTSLSYRSLGILLSATHLMLLKYSRTVEESDWVNLLSALSVSIKSGYTQESVAIGNMATKVFKDSSMIDLGKSKELNKLYSLLQNNLYTNTITGKQVKGTQAIKPAIGYLLVNADDIVNREKYKDTNIYSLGQVY